jgi:hypothetical protein
MLFDAHKNFAYSLVALAPSPATSGTTLTVARGDGPTFPTPPFNGVVWSIGSLPLAANAEVLRVTAITGDVLTIVRSQEGTSVRAILIGDQISAAITAKTLTDVEDATTTETVRAEAAEALEASTREAANSALAASVAAEVTRAEAAEALALVKSSNLADVASVTTARTNLGLGTAATQASSAFDNSGAAAAAQAASLQKSSNLADVASVTTARTNLGLANALIRITYNTGTSSYNSTRPSTSLCPAGTVEYVGPVTPPDWVDGDTWVDDS